MKIVKISSKNQITLPQEMLKSLQVAPRQSVLIDQRGEEIVVKPLKESIVEQTAGSLTKYVHPSKLGVPFATVMEETKRIVAKELAKEGT